MIGHKKVTDRQEAPEAPKTRWERKLRHASRVAKPKRPVIKEGRLLAAGLADQRQWMDS